MPRAIEMVDVRLAEPGDAIAADQLHQALAVQDIEDRERPPARTHLVHRRLVELAPLRRELDRIDAFDALRLRKGADLAADAGPPVDHGAEDVEQAGANVHQSGLLQHQNSRSEGAASTPDAKPNDQSAHARISAQNS